MAPEQMSGDSPVTARADTYSLAVVTYEALTGQRPFQAESVPSIVYKVVNEIPPPPRKWNVELPPHYDTVFARALSKDPMARPATATEFMTSLVPKDLGKTMANLFRPVPDTTPRHAVEGSTDAGATWDIPPAEIAAKAKETAPQRAVVRGLRRHARWVAAAVVLGAAAVFAWPRAVSPPPPAAPVIGRAHRQRARGGRHLGGRGGVGHLAADRAGRGAGPPQGPRSPPPGFSDAELGIVVPGDGKYPPLHFVLQPIAARVRIDSVPAGVAVSVDGEHTGITPVDMVLLEPGRHEIRMDREGLRPWVKEVDARIGESFAVEARLQPVDTGSAAGMEPTQPGMLIELGQGVTPPRKVSGDLAPYPDEARARKLQGAVTVDMIITEDGNPIDVTVVESAGADPEPGPGRGRARLALRAGAQERGRRPRPLARPPDLPAADELRALECGARGCAWSALLERPDCTVCGSSGSAGGPAARRGRPPPARRRGGRRGPRSSPRAARGPLPRGATPLPAGRGPAPRSPPGTRAGAPRGSRPCGARTGRRRCSAG